MNNREQMVRVARWAICLSLFAPPAFAQSEMPLKVGGDVAPPRVIAAPDPAYPKQARVAQHEGTVVLWVVIGSDGTVHDVKVARSLILDLDKAATNAVRKWTFQPAMLNGKPVSVQINVEVNFRLYSDEVQEAALSAILSQHATKSGDVTALQEQASTGDGQAQLLLGCIYFHGIQGISGNRGEAINWWVHAAEQNIAEAQFLLAEAFQNGTGVARDTVEAYKWFYIAHASGYAAAGVQLDELEKKLGRKRIMRAKQAAQEWQQSHSKHPL